MNKMGNLLDTVKTSVRDIRVNVPASLVDNAPTIAVGVGIVAGVGAAVWACKKTLALPAIIEEQKKEREEIKEVLSPEEDKKAYSKALAVNYAATGLKVIKLYSGPVIIGVLAGSSIIAGTNELKSRNAALTATVSTLETMYARYRKNVVERYGAEVDRELKYGIKHNTIKVKEEDPETGKMKTVKKDVIEVDKAAVEGENEYARIFERGITKYFDNSPEYNYMVLKDTQANANRILKDRGYLFLNEVYEMLGYAPTEAGRNVGWIYDPHHEVTPEDYIGDGSVSFGIDKDICPEAREFAFGYQPFLILDFNVDGDITKDGLYIKANRLRRDR